MFCCLTVVTTTQDGSVPIENSLRRLERGQSWFFLNKGFLCDGAAIEDDSLEPFETSVRIRVRMDQARGRLEFASGGVTVGTLDGVTGSDLRFCCYVDGQGSWTIESCAACELRPVNAPGAHSGAQSSARGRAYLTLDQQPLGARLLHSEILDPYIHTQSSTDSKSTFARRPQSENRATALIAGQAGKQGREQSHAPSEPKANTQSTCKPGEFGHTISALGVNGHSGDGAVGMNEPASHGCKANDAGTSGAGHTILKLRQAIAGRAHGSAHGSGEQQPLGWEVRRGAEAQVAGVAPMHSVITRLLDQLGSMGVVQEWQSPPEGLQGESAELLRRLWDAVRQVAAQAAQSPASSQDFDTIRAHQEPHAPAPNTPTHTLVLPLGA